MLLDFTFGCSQYVHDNMCDRRYFIDDARYMPQEQSLTAFSYELPHDMFSSVRLPLRDYD